VSALEWFDTVEAETSQVHGVGSSVTANPGAFVNRYLE
jgi:hypothetical protein